MFNGSLVEDYKWEVSSGSSSCFEGSNSIDFASKRCFTVFNTYKQMRSNEHAFVIQRFLPVYDQIFAGAEVEKVKDHPSIHFAQIYWTIKEVFADLGVQIINKTGEKVDPRFHIVDSFVEDEDCEEGTVTRVLQHGFVINGHIIRPALVVATKR